jgi:regulator of sigma E protease
MDIGWKILWGLIGISLLITIHEYGHYWVARRLGFKVLRFSVGLGKPLWKRVGKAPDHVEFVIAAVPLGGYVRMLDERDGAVPPEDLARSFTRKPPWQRILVLLAGPAANLLFAVAVLWGMFWVQGVQGVKPVIGDVTINSLAANAGIRSQDIIVGINGRAVIDRGEAAFRLLDAVSDDGAVALRVQGANGDERDVAISVEDPEQRFEMTKPGKLMRGLGFEFKFWVPPIPAQIFSVEKGGPADLAGLKPGDIIVSIDGQAMRNWLELTSYVHARPNKEIVLTVRRGESEFSRRVTTLRVPQDGKEIGMLKIGPSDRIEEAVPAQYKTHVDLGPFGALAAGAGKAWEMTVAQSKFFWRMITRRISTDNLTSVITIADYAGRAASAGPMSFLMLLVLLSLSIGFLNLLPIPILDGGQIVFQAAEWIRGRPLSERVYLLGQQAGLLAIVLLMGVALFNDLITYIFPGAGK